jgi:uncharacterized protein YxjI
MADFRSGSASGPAGVETPIPAGTAQANAAAAAKPTSSTAGGALGAAFHHPSYLIRKKVLSLAGGTFHVYDPNGALVFYSKQKAFKLKEDIRLYTGEDMRTELLTILARQVIDFSAAYDVIDPATQAKIGALRRKGWKSALRDEWVILDPQDMEIGLLQEDSMGLALLRRFITGPWIPQKYSAQVRGQHAALLKQNFNPFVFKLTVDFSADRAKLLDRRLGLAAGLLLSAIEGREG